MSKAVVLADLMRPFVYRSILATVLAFGAISAFMIGESYLSIKKGESAVVERSVVTSKEMIQERLNRLRDVLNILKSSPEVRNLVGFREYSLRDNYDRQKHLVDEFFSYFPIIDSSIKSLAIDETPCKTDDFRADSSGAMIQACRSVGVGISIQMEVEFSELIKALALPEGVRVLLQKVEGTTSKDRTLFVNESLSLELVPAEIDLWGALRPMVFRILAVGIFGTLALSVLFVRLIRFYHKDLSRIVEALTRASSSGMSSFETLKVEQTSFAPIISALNRLISTAGQAKELEAEARIGAMARQVAHDIRSPIMAIDVVLSDLGGVSEDSRVLLRGASQRIKDIANNLLGKGKNKIPHSEKKNEDSSMKRHLIWGVLESIVSEKRVQYQSQTGISIHLQVSNEAYELFAAIDAAEFKRLISNLVNNSIEAMVEEKGQITVSLVKPKKNSVNISVTDDGRGIPKELLSQIGTKGGSFGKETSHDAGSGLGLYHAKETILAWGGELTIVSTPGSGTTVSLELPLVEPPDWWVEKIELKEGDLVAVLDDDPTVHQVWSIRLKSLDFDVTMVNFYSPGDFLEWQQTNSADLYFFDYELMGESKNGLDVIELVGVSSKSILVTSRYEEAQVLKRAEELRVKVLPKSLASQVPIERT